MNKRQIKFRVWTGTSFDTSNNFAISSDGTLGKICDGDAQFCNCLNDGPFVIQQFTGIFDKNGKEIYEGDIVNTAYSEESARRNPNNIETFTVEFGRQEYTDIDPCYGLTYVGFSPELLLRDYIEVVGNIFEK